MDIKTDICTWLLKQQEWFQVLAENLIAKGSLSVEDINCIVALIKTPEGQSVTKNRTFDGLASPEANDDTLRIIKIDTVRGIENLAPRIPLDFGTGNLTVIYGHNGSGKSSYTRVLKRVSGKPRAAPLKPNVFQPTPPEQSCHITWEINGVSESESWTSNSAAINALKVIDIFDTDEAQHYLTQESTATYIPSVVSFF
ncbi:hypothetical protein [Morganella psychrotolerans]|nr:hypothetical protein [Morganella psychrotolerans]